MTYGICKFDQFQFCFYCKASKYMIDFYRVNCCMVLKSSFKFTKKKSFQYQLIFFLYTTYWLQKSTKIWTNNLVCLYRPQPKQRVANVSNRQLWFGNVHTAHVVCYNNGNRDKVTHKVIIYVILLVSSSHHQMIRCNPHYYTVSDDSLWADTSSLSHTVNPLRHWSTKQSTTGDKLSSLVRHLSRGA